MKMKSKMKYRVGSVEQNQEKGRKEIQGVSVVEGESGDIKEIEAMASKSEKLVYGIVTAVILFIAAGLDLGGSFFPQWTRPFNETSPETGGNVSFSLWTKRECWDELCRTKVLLVKWTMEECVESGGTHSCEIKTGYKNKPKTECVDVYYCNTTFLYKEDPNKIPSLVFVAKAFETPAFIAGLIGFILYICKIIMLARCPETKRLHLKAAYLTFCAIAGAAAEIGVIIFCVMLEKEYYHLGWAPALPGIGGFFQLAVAFGGYLGWRNGPGDDFYDEDDEAFLQHPSTPPKKPARLPPPPPPKPTNINNTTKTQRKPSNPESLILRPMNKPPKPPKPANI